MATIATLFNSFLNPPKSAQLKNPALPLSLSRPSISPARIPIQAVSLFNDNRQFPQPISKPGLPEDVLSVVNPSLAYANTLFFNSAYNVVEENEPVENLLNRFQREVMKAGDIQESKRNRRRQQDTLLSSWDETLNRRLLIILVTSGLYPAFPSYGKTKSKNPYDEKRLLEQNRRIQKDNNAPPDFPNFVREGFAVKVLASDNYVKHDSGLVLWDIAVGDGDCPKDGQQVTFHYIGYNESGRRIDSTYLQGSPAKIRMGTNALVPGFEEGIRDMKPGGKRRIIIPPELGPPVGPSTFFSSKQFEVFDVELLSIQDCKRRTIAFYSDVVCNE